eukprot:4827994-Prymnesium_polylepis.1
MCIRDRRRVVRRRASQTGLCPAAPTCPLWCALCPPQVSMLLFVLMGSVAGYTSAVTYKAFKGVHWKALTLLTAFLYPGITFGIFFFLNFFVWGK